MELINRLAAESGVRDVITRIALIGDVGEPEDYAQIYSTDTVWNWGHDPQRGHR